ncbi:MAG: molybdopterin biosynthesis protein [Pseudooceanicola sp.]|nr:molybdopterin biosynthesis protein [Pseudooceanicola sp.]
MKFGPVAPADALGAVLAHSLTLGKTRLRKGRVLDKADIDGLIAADLAEIIVARLDIGDVPEDTAAARLAKALVPDPDAAGLRHSTAFTGRVNLIATGPGVITLDAGAITAFNSVHPMITVATVPPWQQVGPGQLVATIKIISYAVSDIDVAGAEEAAKGAIRLLPPVHRTAGLVVTEIPNGPDSDKGIAATRTRVEALGLTLDDVQHVPHRVPDLAEALGRLKGDIALILTGSATSDIHDVAPTAVISAGGTVTRFGLPVDPGNLLFLGRIGSRPVIGLPGCARSPALNGADWVLARVACGVDITDSDFAAMGVGGLLKEIPTRPQPRRRKPKPS